MGLRTRLVLASTAGVVSGVLTLWIALAVGAEPLSGLGGWAVAGLGIGVAISAGLVLHLTRVPMRTIASVREGLARAAGDHRERDLVLRHPLADGRHGGVRHGDRHLARLAHHHDLLGRLDHAHLGQKPGGVDQAPRRDLRAQALGDQRG